MFIVCDLDGVLGDFPTAAGHVHGLPDGTVPTNWNWYEDFGISDEVFWSKIHDLGDEFYGQLVQPYSWAQEVLDMVADAGDFVIMSSPSNHPAGYAGKKVFLDKHFPHVDSKSLIVGSRKELLAGSDRLLIDDGLHNIEAFRAAGGHTHLFLQPWNSIGNCEGRVDNLRARLNLWKDGRNG